MLTYASGGVWTNQESRDAFEVTTKNDDIVISSAFFKQNYLIVSCRSKHQHAVLDSLDLEIVLDEKCKILIEPISFEAIVPQNIEEGTLLASGEMDCALSSSFLYRNEIYATSKTCSQSV
jgi:hypothetical protein